MLDLYRNIKTFRLQNKMTQDELARLTGYTDRSSIAKIEGGDVDLPQSKIMLFAKALGVNAGELMGNSGLSSPVASPIQTLSPDEAELLGNYQKLNPEGKTEARKQVRNLTKIEDYTKDSGSGAKTA